MSWGNEHHKPFTWLQKSPMFSWKIVDFSRLILISLETVERLFANQMLRWLSWQDCGGTTTAMMFERPRSPSTLRLYETRTQVTHCSWMCCWKLGRLRSFRARRRIFFSSSVIFFCPISFNFAAASIAKNEGQQWVSVRALQTRFGGALLKKNETPTKKERLLR